MFLSKCRVPLTLNLVSILTHTVIVSMCKTIRSLWASIQLMISHEVINPIIIYNSKLLSVIHNAYLSIKSTSFESKKWNTHDRNTTDFFRDGIKERISTSMSNGTHIKLFNVSYNFRYYNHENFFVFLMWVKRNNLLQKNVSLKKERFRFTYTQSIYRRKRMKSFFARSACPAIVNCSY